MTTAAATLDQPEAPDPPAGLDAEGPHRSVPWRRLRVPFAATAVVQAILVAGDRLPSIDALAYFESGRSLLGGHGYLRQGSPELHFPPGLPVALASLYRITGDELAALQLWNFAWGIALVAAMVAVAHRIAHDDDVTVVTAWLATTVGGGVCLAIRGGAGSEAPTAVLTLVAVLLGLRLTEPGAHPAGRALARGAACGALMGMAYLMRPEALPWCFALVAAMAAQVYRQRRTNPIGRPALAALVGLAVALGVFVAPYVAYQHAERGTWSITAKSKEASIESWQAIADGNRLRRDQLTQTLNADNTSMEGQTRSLTALAREHPRQWLGIFGTNLRTLAELYLVWQLVPLFLLIPAIERMWHTRRHASTLLFAVAALVPVATSLLFFTLARYLLLTTAILVPYGTWGLVRWMRARSARARTPLWVAVAILSLVSLGVAAWPLLPASPAREHTEQQTAGAWIDANTPAGSRIMTRSYHVQHTAHRPVVTLPAAPLADVLAFARNRGVTYLVADEATIRGRRPNLTAALIDAPRPPDGLELVHQFTERGRTVRIFRLTPPPPASDLPPVPLGYVSD